MLDPDASGVGDPIPAGAVTRRITPKSVFIAPSINGDQCAEGYQQDDMGRCVKVVKVDAKKSWDLLLDKLNNQFGSDSDPVIETTPPPGPPPGPLQVAIPIAEGPASDSDPPPPLEDVVVAPPQSSTTSSSTPEPPGAPLDVDEADTTPPSLSDETTTAVTERDSVVEEQQQGVVEMIGADVQDDVVLVPEVVMVSSEERLHLVPHASGLIAERVDATVPSTPPVRNATRGDTNPIINTVNSSPLVMGPIGRHPPTASPSSTPSGASDLVPSSTAPPAPSSSTASSKSEGPVSVSPASSTTTEPRLPSSTPPSPSSPSSTSPSSTSPSSTSPSSTSPSSTSPSSTSPSSTSPSSTSPSSASPSSASPSSASPSSASPSSTSPESTFMPVSSVSTVNFFIPSSTMATTTEELASSFSSSSSSSSLSSSSQSSSEEMERERPADNRLRPTSRFPSIAPEAVRFPTEKPTLFRTATGLVRFPTIDVTFPTGSGASRPDANWLREKPVKFPKDDSLSLWRLPPPSSPASNWSLEQTRNKPYRFRYWSRSPSRLTPASFGESLGGSSSSSRDSLESGSSQVPSSAWPPPPHARPQHTGNSFEFRRSSTSYTHPHLTQSHRRGRDW